jgi:hypothetical protein
VYQRPDYQLFTVGIVLPTNLHLLFSLRLLVAFLLITGGDGFFWTDVRKIE